MLNSMLIDLMKMVSPCMYEKSVRAYIRQQLQALGMQVETDIMGNIHAFIGSSNALQVGVVAHMDTIGLQISSILSNGMATCRFLGIKSHVALGQPVMVITDNGIIEGAIGFDTTSQYGQPKGLIEEDLWLDVGVSSQEQAQELISVGDLVVLVPRLSILNDKYLCGAGLDDRVGVYVLLEVAKQLVAHNLPLGLHFYGTVQEELGLRGANIIAHNNIDICFVVDVDYATDTPSSHENQMGRLLLGQGVGVHIKADNNPILRMLTCKVAEQHNIPYQKTIGRNVYGGTDASAIQLEGRGVATMNLNIPCRYMHSPIEMCHLDDVNHAVKLLVETITTLSNGNYDLRPQ